MSFDRLAPHYDWMEAVTGGRLLQRARTAWLDELAGRRRILSMGEGHGRFAAACAARFPEAELTCVDASPAMIARGRRRVGSEVGPRVSIRWLCETLPAWDPPPAAFDAVVTCFFLDCFEPPALGAVVASLARTAGPEATWHVVDFDLPRRGPARWRAAGMLAVMYAFFRVAAGIPARRLASPAGLIRAHGFVCVRRRTFSWGLIRSEVWRRDVAGAGNGRAPVVCRA